MTPTAMRDAIMVTQSSLPPLEEYLVYLKQIWESHWLTNNGPLVRQLEAELRAKLESPDLWYVTNCTTALQIALKALAVKGEVITTPFTYVATAGAVLWENCVPVFVDVRSADLTLDPDLVARAITPRTTAILATHVYGFPCAVNELDAIASQHGLKVIYDAAHAFGCRLHGRPLVRYGHISCLSFHATKVFHTVEGGAVIINGDSALAERVRLMRAFGHFGDDHRSVGINGKNSELHAAMGLCNLPHFAERLERRREQHNAYTQKLQGSGVRQPCAVAKDFEYNYAYYPVLFPDESAAVCTLSALAERNIHARRYFYPSVNRIGYIEGEPCPVSEHAAKTVLCLPLSDAVSPAIQDEIVSVIRAVMR